MSRAVDRLAAAVELLDASAELIAIKDPSGHFVAANLAFARALRTDRTRLAGARNEDFFGSDAGADLSACEHLALLAGEAIERQLDVSLDGEPKTLRVVCTPWMDGGVCAGLVLACSADVAGTAEDGRTLHAYADAVARLAHRFNNALTTVMGLADWHLVAQTHEAPLRADLEKIRTAAQQAEQTAREIQQLTRQTAASLAGHPSAAAPEPAANGERKAEPLDAKRPVLLVDDEPAVRASLAVMIRTLGHEVHAVDSAREALAWLEGAEPSVVLSDLAMPGTTGTELAAQAHARWPAVPFVLMTGWATGNDQLPPHVAAILPKPLRMAQLRQVLEAIARHQQ
jgi:CheY-like chemotaxis protein